MCRLATRALGVETVCQGGDEWNTHPFYVDEGQKHIEGWLQIEFERDIEILPQDADNIFLVLGAHQAAIGRSP